MFSAYNRRNRIFEVPIWHLKNTRVRKKDGRGGRRTLPYVFTVLFELIGVSLLFIKQNSLFVILIVLGVVLLVVGMMVIYTKIESKYKV